MCDEETRKMVEAILARRREEGLAYLRREKEWAEAWRKAFDSL